MQLSIQAPLPVHPRLSGTDPLSRFLEIQPFVIAQLTRDFRDVKAENVVRNP